MLNSLKKIVLEMIDLTLTGVLLGSLIGVVVSLFGQMIVWLGSVRDANSLNFIVFLPVIGVMIILLYQQFLSQSKVGLELIFDLANEKANLPISYFLIIMTSSCLTHLFGGSAGRTGAAIQIGASLAYFFYPYVQSYYKTSQLFVFAGLAAGFASLFQLPFAALSFALEILPWKNVTKQTFFVAFVASLTAGFVSYFCGLIPYRYELLHVYKFNLLHLGQLIILGLLFGLVGNLFAILMTQFKKFIPRYLPNAYWRIFVLSFILVGVISYFNGRYSGLGSSLIPLGKTDDVLAYDWFVKLVLTALTISIGFQGGEVTPLFAIGSTFGAALSGWMDLPTELVIALGYLSVFASATNTFLTPLFLSLGIFGPYHVMDFLITLSISYFLTHNYSIYPNERQSLWQEYAHRLLKK